MHVQYLTDSKGHQTAVVVPIEDWTRLTAKVSKLQNKALVFQDIKTAFQEIEDFKAGKTSLHPVEDLFND
ncbi:MAG TPA: hypothetical protein VN132_11535 [Bdellovibrio sp.]|nr:hypothetical protein [Bdellovibrio sp.]